MSHSEDYFIHLGPVTVVTLRSKILAECFRALYSGIADIEYYLYLDGADMCNGKRLERLINQS